jgi:hypothetical protein
VSVLAQPVNHSSTIRVPFGEELEFAMRDIIELLQCAFTLRYLGLGSRIVINEALLLLSEIEMAPTGLTLL